MKKAILLVRVSTKQQSYDKQRDELFAVAKNDGFNESNIIIIENKESAIKIKDETESLGLTKLFQNIESDSEISCVYAWELSRIGRKEEVNLKVKNFLISHKVNLKVLNPNFTLLDKNGNVDKGNEIVFSIFNTMAQQEMFIKKERLKRGTIEAKEDGKIGTGKPLFGYKVDASTKKIVIDTEKSTIVLFLFSEYAKGKGIMDIYNKAYELGYMRAYKNKRAAKAVITDILSRREYCGTFTEKGVVRYPRIISDELFEECQEMKVQNKPIKKCTKHTYLGSGILRRNGEMMVAKYSAKAYCSYDNDFCVSIKLIDWILWDAAKKFKSKTDVESYEDYVNSMVNEMLALDTKIVATKKRLKDIESQAERVETIYELGDKSLEWFKEKITAIKRQKQDEEKNLDFFKSRLSQIENILNEEKRKENSKVMTNEQMDEYFCDVKGKKDVINEEIEKAEITEDGDGFRKIEITAKNGIEKITYFYKHFNGCKIEVYIEKNGDKIPTEYKWRKDKNTKRVAD